jgi:hypothetical protein
MVSVRSVAGDAYFSLRLVSSPVLPSYMALMGLGA